MEGRRKRKQNWAEGEPSLGAGSTTAAGSFGTRVALKEGPSSGRDAQACVHLHPSVLGWVES